MGNSDKIKIFIFISIISSIVVFVIYLAHLPPLNIDIPVENNAINILTTIIQIQAGILAIIVLLTLVAVQISSQRFSPRLMQMFTNKIEFWGILSFYLFTIIAELILLWLSDFYPYKYEFIFVSIILMIIANIFLFLYIEYSINILKPDQAIILIGKDIKNKEVENFLLNDEKITKNPFIVLTDVIFNSIISKDQITVINGIDTFESIFESYFICIVKKYGNIDLDEDYETYIKYTNSINYFSETIIEIFDKCINNHLFDVCIYCSDIIYDMYKFGSENKSNLYIGEFIDSLMVIDDKTGSFSKENYFKDSRENLKAIDLITRPLYQIGNTVAIATKYEENSVIIDASLTHLEKVAVYYFNNPKSEFKSFSDIYEPDHPFKSPIRLKNSIKSIIQINDTFLNNDSDPSDLYIFNHTINFLGKCGKNSLRLDFRDLYKDIIDHLFDSYYKLLNSKIDIYDSLENFNSAISTSIVYWPEDKEKYIRDFRGYGDEIENKIVNLLVYCIKNGNDAHFNKISSLLFEFYNFWIRLSEDTPLGPLKSRPTPFSRIFSECVSSCNLEILISTVKKLISMITENSLFGKIFGWEFLIDSIFRNLIYRMFELYKDCKVKNFDNLLNLLKEFSEEVKEKNEDKDYVHELMIEILQDKDFGLGNGNTVELIKGKLKPISQKTELKEEDISKFKEIIDKYDSN